MFRFFCNYFTTKFFFRDFAHSSFFQYALQREYALYLSTKNAILKKIWWPIQRYFPSDLRHVSYCYNVLSKWLCLDKVEFLFVTVSTNRYTTPKRYGTNTEWLTWLHVICYEAMKSEGGFVWACKNYDGDVQSDSVAQGYGRCIIYVSLYFISSYCFFIFNYSIIWNDDLCSYLLQWKNCWSWSRPRNSHAPLPHASTVKRNFNQLYWY